LGKAFIWHKEMAKLKFIVVGKTKAPFLRQGEEFYLHKIRHYVNAEWIEVRGAKATKGKPDQKVLTEESLQIQKRIGARDFVVSLDMRGKALDSLELSRFLEGLLAKGRPITFIIGGPLGLHVSVEQRANETISLTRLTLTHELSRLVLLEQVYRAFTIITGRKYHK